LKQSIAAVTVTTVTVTVAGMFLKKRAHTGPWFTSEGYHLLVAKMNLSLFNTQHMPYIGLQAYLDQD
jgi:hypothetical protein